jgi:hypothetical protein
MLIALIDLCEVPISGLVELSLDLWHHVDDPRKPWHSLVTCDDTQIAREPPGNGGSDNSTRLYSNDNCG